MRIAPEVQPKGITKETIEDNPSSEFRDAVEKISIEFKDVLERVHYVDLIALVIQKQNELCQEDFDIEQFYEELYDFYGEYDTEEIIKFIEKLKKYPDLAYKYFEKHWQYLDPNWFFESLDQAGGLLIRGDIELVPLKRLAKQLNNEKKPKRLQELSFELKEQVDKVLQNNKYVVWGGHDEEPLTKEMLSYLGTREMVSQEIGQDAISINSFEEIAFALQKAKFEIKFQETVGLIDKERLREETKKYGAKGANLQMILEVIQAIQNITWSLDESCFIPDFERIPVSVYRKWKNGESIRSELEPFFAWINQRNVMVRSSAVYSEDNEETTGAGIYESLSLDEGVTIDDFESAVVSVFKSVDTDEAKKYRAQNGVQLEEMGIVLQESVSYFSNHDKGYVNTVLKQVPQLMDIVFESGFRPVLRKNAIEHKCANASEEQSLFHYQIDWHKYDDSMSIERLAMLSFLLEKYYGQTLQIEFILAEKEDQHSYSRGKQIAILQTRFLPKKFSESAQIEFPQKELLFEGRALGITDTILDILPNYKDNSEHEGVVIFESSRFGSMGHNFSDYNFPKKGVVVVLGPSIENFGHIETLCAEKGLFLIFNCNYHSQRESSMAGLGFSGNMGGSPIDDFHGHKRLHLVLNGLEGKIYVP